MTSGVRILIVKGIVAIRVYKTLLKNAILTSKITKLMVLILGKYTSILRLRTNGGGPDDEALFIQKLTPTKVLLIQASNGERVAEIQSTDDSAFVAFCEHDCDNSTTRSSSGTSNLLFSGHDNGVIQMWDLQTAGVMFKKGSGKSEASNASLDSHEMAKLIDTSRRLQL